MKSIIKRVVYVVLTVILIGLIAVITHYVTAAKIKDIVENKLNENLSGKLMFRELNVSLFRNFPHATIILNDVVVKDGESLKNGFVFSSANMFLRTNITPLNKQNNIVVSGVTIDQAKIHGHISDIGNFVMNNLFNPDICATQSSDITCELQYLKIKNFTLDDMFIYRQGRIVRNPAFDLSIEGDFIADKPKLKFVLFVASPIDQNTAKIPIVETIIYSDFAQKRLNINNGLYLQTIPFDGNVIFNDLSANFDFNALIRNLTTNVQISGVLPNNAPWTLNLDVVADESIYFIDWDVKEISAHITENDQDSAEHSFNLDLEFRDFFLYQELEPTFKTVRFKSDIDIDPKSGYFAMAPQLLDVDGMQININGRVVDASIIEPIVDLSIDIPKFHLDNWKIHNSGYDDVSEIIIGGEFSCNAHFCNCNQNGEFSGSFVLSDGYCYRGSLSQSITDINIDANINASIGEGDNIENSWIKIDLNNLFFSFAGKSLNASGHLGLAEEMINIEGVMFGGVDLDLLNNIIPLDTKLTGCIDFDNQISMTVPADIANILDEYL